MITNVNKCACAGDHLIKMDVAQTASFLQSMTYEAGLLDYEEFPITAEPVWLLGREYNALHELDELKCDFMSRLWLTYRRGYCPIGGTGPSTDTGWGCMLRCGQMMMAQALVNRHLGRDWRWIPGKYDPKSFEILRLFLDKKDSTYSIHQIASMGASEGKTVGEWFGPNTIAQVLKKLAVYDEWSNIVVHVALDNTVVIDDLRAMCLEDNPMMTSDQPQKSCTCDILKSPSGSVNGSTDQKLPSVHLRNRTKRKTTTCDTNGLTNDKKNNFANEAKNAVWGQKAKGAKDSNDADCCRCGTGSKQRPWRPLLLIIPLRLGLSDINPVYISALKKCLKFPQSVGIIGGKPNHAHWFVGFVDDQLLFLDPHTSQPFSDITLPDQTDYTYHCEYISRMKAVQLDPSIAVGFYCGSESEFADLCHNIQTFLIHEEKTPMFELHQHRPPHWPPFEAYSPEGATGIDFTVVDEADRLFDTDEEFELL